MGRTSAKVRATKLRQKFRTKLDPKLTFWCVSIFLGAFGTVWLSYETRCKTGRTSAKDRATKSHQAKDRATKSRQNFSKRTHPIHSIGP